MLKLPQNMVTLILGILTINVIGLWTVQLLIRTPGVPFTIVPSAQKTTTVPDTSEHIDQLAAELAQLSQQVASLSTSTSPTVSPTTVTTAKTTNTIVSGNSVKEHSLYLGSGSTTNREWTDLNGTKITIDPANYGRIKSVLFEASLSIIGGEAQARLINKTTGGIITATELAHNFQTATWKTSPSFFLSAGGNEYLVQLRSTSGELAQLNAARIKIVIE